MKLLRINKYILKTIFSNIKFTKELNIVRYNRKLQSKLGISLYSYQKKYFEKIITPALLNHTEILLQNNLFDKKTLSKLISEWENETTEALQEKDCFHINQKASIKNLNDIKILNISLKDQSLLEKITTNLIELNVSNIKNLELPCSILLNLETLSLKDISKLKFLNKAKNINLNKLRHLYLNNISFDKKNKIKISLNNVKYLDLRLKEQDGFYFQNDNNKAGFNKEKTIQHLINIFDFPFLSIFKKEKEESYDEDGYGELIYEIYNDLSETFQKPEELFDKKYLSKYDFFNFEILFEWYDISGSAEFSNRFIYKYLFAKTKGNKFIFKTEYIDYVLSNFDCERERFDKEIRYCNNINYNNYYFINNESKIEGSVPWIMLDSEKFNSFSINLKKNHDKDYVMITALEYFKKNKNQLEILTINDVDLSFADSFLNNLESLEKLKCFYITKDLKYKNNNQLIDLLTILSKMKSLFLIDITLKSEINLNKNEEEKINKILPDISFIKSKKESAIKWFNNNYQLIISSKA